MWLIRYLNWFRTVVLCNLKMANFSGLSVSQYSEVALFDPSCGALLGQPAEL
jgi:hypothetical protein